MEENASQEKERRELSKRMTRWKGGNVDGEKCVRASSAVIASLDNQSGGQDLPLQATLGLPLIRTTQATAKRRTCNEISLTHSGQLILWTTIPHCNYMSWF